MFRMFERPESYLDELKKSYKDDYFTTYTETKYFDIYYIYYTIKTDKDVSDKHFVGCLDNFDTAKSVVKELNKHYQNQREYDFDKLKLLSDKEIRGFLNINKKTGGISIEKTE